MYFCLLAEMLGYKLTGQSEGRGLKIKRQEVGEVVSIMYSVTGYR